MNIQEEIKSIEENLAKETERLNKLREQMNKPKTLESEFANKSMYWFNCTGRDIIDNIGYRAGTYPTRNIAEKELLRARLIQWAYVLNGGEFVPMDGVYAYCLTLSREYGKVIINSFVYGSIGQVFFKTRELAEEAISKFTKEELIKLLS